MQICRVRGSHRLGREQGNTAKNRDWDHACMGLTSAPQTMHPGDAYSLAVFLQSAWPDAHSRTAPRGCKFIRVGTIRTPHCPHHLNRNIIFRITYKKPNTSRYAQGVRCADGVSLTQEEHYSIGICFTVFYHSCAAPVVCCSTPRSSEGEQVRAPHGVRELHAPHVGCV